MVDNLFSMMIIRHIITAAHCFLEPSHPRDFLILPGLHKVKLPLIDYSISEWNTPTHNISLVATPKG